MKLHRRLFLGTCLTVVGLPGCAAFRSDPAMEIYNKASQKLKVHLQVVDPSDTVIWKKNLTFDPGERRTISKIDQNDPGRYGITANVSGEGVNFSKSYEFQSGQADGVNNVVVFLYEGKNDTFISQFAE